MRALTQVARILVDFIRRRVFREEQIEQPTREEQVDQPRESDEPTESLDCSCAPAFSNDHPPDLKRLLGIFRLVQETLDPLFHILEPIHAFQPLEQLGVRMTWILETAIEDLAGAKFYTEKLIEDLEKLLRNEPVDPEQHLETTRRERTFGLRRRMELLLMRQELGGNDSD